MKMHNRLLVSLSALATAVALTGPSLAKTPADALVMAWNIDAISTFDPAQIGEVVTIELIGNMCDRLMEYDPDDPAKVLPGLAESYSVSEDGKTLTFKIRDGLKFQSGNPATAEEMAWSLRRVVKIGLGASAALTEYGFDKDNVDQRITAPDANTVVMEFDQAYPASLLLQAIAAYPISIMLDQKVLEANQIDGDLGNKYLATRTACVGPYTLARWNPGEVVIMERNADYWGEEPPMKNVVVRHVAEAATQRLLIEKGDIDIARDLTPEDVEAVRANPDISVTTTPKPQVTYLALNNENPLFADARVRLALRYMLDYDGMMNSFLKNIGIKRQTPVQVGAFGALDEAEGTPFTLDLDKAKALLAEAGVKPGTKISLILGTHPYSMPIGQHFQQNAAKLGLEVSVERMANAQLFAKVRGREFEMGVMSWQTSVNDAHGMLSRHLYNPNNAIEAKLTQYPSWRSAFFSEEYNTRVLAALAERDPAKRKEMYEAMQRDQFEDGPQVFMFQTTQNVAHRKEISGWYDVGLRAFYNKISK